MNNTPETVNTSAPAEKPARPVSPFTAAKREENKGNRDTAARIRLLTAARHALDTAAANRRGTDAAANAVADKLNRDETRECFTAEERAELLAACETLRKGVAPSRAVRATLAGIIAREAEKGENSRREKETATGNAAAARAAENAAKSARKSRKAEILAAAASRPLTAEEVAFLAGGNRKAKAAAAA